MTPGLHRLVVSTGLAAALAGCASFSHDGGFGPVTQMANERSGQSPRWVRSDDDRALVKARAAELLGQPLTADAAVELALLNNPGLQARFDELGIAEADLVRAGRLHNPVFGYEHLKGGGASEIDRSLMVDLLGLLTMPLAREAEQRNFEAAQLQAASEAVQLAARTRKAWIEAVAAQQLQGYFEQVQQAADASSELATRMAQAGNFSKLQQQREQAFEASVRAQTTRAAQRIVATRERLIRSLGLTGDQLAFRLPPRLPDLPAVPVDGPAAAQGAIDRRLDVMMARRRNDAAAKSFGLTRATSFINVLDVGYANKRQSGEPAQDGWRIELELPLFDFGAARNARAEAVYRQSMQRTAQVAIDAASQVRETWSAYRSAYHLARHYRDEVVPLQKQIADENLLRYNGMLISVFDLLADAREQITSVSASVEALRDLWLADTDLQTALTLGPPDTESATR